jgi:hypothetical protein
LALGTAVMEAISSAARMEVNTLSPLYRRAREVCRGAGAGGSYLNLAYCYYNDLNHDLLDFYARFSS